MLRERKRKHLDFCFVTNFWSQAAATPLFLHPPEEPGYFTDNRDYVLQERVIFLAKFVPSVDGLSSGMGPVSSVAIDDVDLWSPSPKPRIPHPSAGGFGEDVGKCPAQRLRHSRLPNVPSNWFLSLRLQHQTGNRTRVSFSVWTLGLQIISQQILSFCFLLRQNTCGQINALAFFKKIAA